MLDKKGQKNIFIMMACLLFVVMCLILSSYYTTVPTHKIFGVSYMTMNNPFYEVMNNEIVKEVEKHGDVLITRDPALDINKQIDQIYSFIEKKVDGIFLNPIDSQKIKPALEAAKKAGIPIIIIDAPVSDHDLVECSVISDNYDAGVQCAKDMMQRMDTANIILLKHSAVQSAKDRIDGFLNTIASHPNYRVVGQGECDGQLEIAMPLMEKLLSKNKHVDVVMALNDPSALGALAALENKGYKDVIVYGVDGTPDLKSLINQSSMVAGTVAQSPISMGKIAAMQMYDYCHGKELEKNIKIPVVFIGKHNIDEYEMGWQ